MPKVFYTILWKQLFQYKSGKREYGIVKKQNNLRIIIVGKKPENN